MNTSHTASRTARPALDFCLRVARAQACVRQHLDDALGTLHGFSFSDFQLLLALQDGPAAGLARATLAERLALTPAGLVRALLPLEKIGLVVRLPGQDAVQPDCVMLTPAARIRLPAALETAQMQCARMLDAGAPARFDALALLHRHSVAVAP